MNRNLKLLLLACAVAAALGGAKYFHIQELLRSSLAGIAGLGPWGPAAFISIYILACVLFIPGSILTLGAGVLFGVAWGSLYVSIASTVGATLAFLIGRYLAREAISRKMEGHSKFKAIDEAVAKEGWKIVGLVRLSPIFPFNLLNYAFGLTRVSLRDYILASWVGMMPGTVMYVYIGSLAGSLAGLGSQARSRTTGEWALYVVGLIATAAVTLYITRIARAALEKRTSA
ncbi:MAG: hypothetical protein CO113_07905 [Elusimicrobia bacterium CG_4_9_14_3_um_filter_62_55]|nr:MAG: hypothetical protein COR54_16670 [Elusimicrobia bacterium CG22_combo_CG10-13_8_21_14_all_63_91]PJA15831.1 MAG: hypothetical protein COX66_08920 [Elusimicrobia bacterium CG_4_10_14_0_2_um_filter_63_34]PJB25581.1 MAG: hypothetical protein CO113_07905 [Elusimicrobia bacterium CG_4_9_14_3_um_filter_62_55]